VGATPTTKDDFSLFPHTLPSIQHPIFVTTDLGVEKLIIHSFSSDQELAVLLPSNSPGLVMN
jgi:hypothetical protein